MEDFKTITLRNGDITLVDAADYESLAKFKWFTNKGKRTKTFYAARIVVIDGKRKLVLMHLALMGELPSPGMEVDHKNGDSLDNRRENLRWATHSQNMRNQVKTRGSSRFKGVHWNKTHSKWHAQIGLNGQRKHLGLFATEEAAARAYDAAALLYFGEFARLNFPKMESSKN